MDIFRAFNLNDEEHIINIQGTVEDPLFQANQVCDLLGIKSFRSHINDFTDEHKVLLKVKTAGGLQDVIFFTELGLYKLLGRSRKEIASQFQNWIIKVIKEIRITGIYKFSLLCQVMKYYWLFTILMLTVRDCSVLLTKIKFKFRSRLRNRALSALRCAKHS